MLELHGSSIERKSEMTIKMDAGIGAFKKNKNKQQTKKRKNRKKKTALLEEIYGIKRVGIQYRENI